MKRLLNYAYLLGSLAACASGAGMTSAHGVQVTDMNGVSGCAYVGDVHGVSPFYGIFGGQALDGAQDAAMERAATMRATHVVWSGSVVNKDGTAVNGGAYRCGR